MTRQTVEGQALELEWVRSNAWQLDDADYLAMVERKTSWYSFITPLHVGAIAAGARPEQLAPLEPLGRHLGAAFQITDDLLNLRADPEDYGKEIGGDLWEGKRLATARPDGFKEWHHYVIHRPGWRLLVNFSLTSQALPGQPPRLVPRVIVIAHDQRWTGAMTPAPSGRRAPASASVIALRPTSVFMPPRAKLLELMSAHPRLADEFLKFDRPARTKTHRTGRRLGIPRSRRSASESPIATCRTP